MKFVYLAVDSQLFQCLSNGGSADVEVLTQDTFRWDRVSGVELDEYFPAHLIDQLEIQRDGIFLSSFQFVFHSRLPVPFPVFTCFSDSVPLSGVIPAGTVVHTSRCQIRENINFKFISVVDIWSVPVI